VPIFPTPEAPTRAIAPAPAPVLPAAPPEPKPLPALPPPTPNNPAQVTPHSKRATQIAPSGQFIVLKGDKLIEGSVVSNGEKVVIRRGALDRSVDRTEVLYIGETRDDVYRFMLAKALPESIDGRLAVANWCTMNGLREQGLTEARAILKLQPGHRAATDLARAVEASLRQFPPDGLSPKGAGVLVTVDVPEADVSAEAATSFATKAQPVLANQCMECHARDDHASSFRLKRVTGFEVGPQSTHANLRAVASQLKKDDPSNSPLLVKALIAHGGMKQPAFVSRQAVAFRVLESWVQSALGNSILAPMIPPALPVVNSPQPPERASQPTTTSPADTTVLPPADVTTRATVPAVLPTPPSIPAADSGSRTTPHALPPIPTIPPGDAGTKQPAVIPAIPAVTPTTALPKPAGVVKLASQFGSGSKVSPPPGTDEFDPATFNRALPPQKSTTEMK